MLVIEKLFSPRVQRRIQITMEVEGRGGEGRVGNRTRHSSTRATFVRKKSPSNNIIWTGNKLNNLLAFTFTEEAMCAAASHSSLHRDMDASPCRLTRSNAG